MELPEINQSQIKRLLYERLTNPEKYSSKPLIVWKSDFRDGIQRRILKEALKEYNEGKSGKDRKWFADCLLGDERQVAYDFRTNPIIKPGEIYSLGLYVIEPVFVEINHNKDSESVSDLYSVINRREWKGIEMLPGIPVVAYMSCKSKWFETPEKYPGTEQYVFKPDFEEWSQWALNKNNIYGKIIDFITKEGESNITCRWYNYFNSDNEGKGKGCRYPKFWDDVFKELVAELEERGLNNIDDLPDDADITLLTNGISQDLIEDFKRDIISKG